MNSQTTEITLQTGKEPLQLRLSARPQCALPLENTDDSELIQSREPCQHCHKKVHLYCYKCCEPTLGGRTLLPPSRVSLPLHLHIILHPFEHRSKSTGLHARILCDTDAVSVHSYPTIPSCVMEDAARTLLVYPSLRSKPLAKTPNLRDIKHVVFIEGTWRQSQAVARSDGIRSLPHVVTLQDYATLFWRFQSEGEGHLSTIEAIYYFFREFHQVRNEQAGESNAYDGRYDDMLFLFVHQYLTIQSHYSQNDGRTFTNRHREGAGYIK
ncbi:DTW domain containing 1 [Perkinsela sp. CCAP 1560/4]|nr:DTW domain containing 1 [Perkinsela sp. CCAP 1560/4]|eukprot:KNH08458.1 DTW domain containing 1 [Perkinsela sp. CCAP 1560/4]